MTTQRLTADETVHYVLDLAEQGLRLEPKVGFKKLSLFSRNFPEQACCLIGLALIGRAGTNYAEAEAHFRLTPDQDYHYALRTPGEFLNRNAVQALTTWFDKQDLTDKTWPEIIAQARKIEVKGE